MTMNSKSPPPTKWWKQLIRKLLTILGSYLILIIFKGVLDPEVLELATSLAELFLA